jgi:hypothetical protein
MLGRPGEFVMDRIISVTRRHLEFMADAGDHQLPPTDDDRVGDDIN